MVAGSPILSAVSGGTECADRQTQDAAFAVGVNGRMKEKANGKPYSDNKGTDFFYLL